MRAVVVQGKQPNSGELRLIQSPNRLTFDSHWALAAGLVLIGSKDFANAASLRRNGGLVEGYLGMSFVQSAASRDGQPSSHVKNAILRLLLCDGVNRSLGGLAQI